MEIGIPPLRKRPEDIDLLAHYFAASAMYNGHYERIDRDDVVRRGLPAEFMRHLWKFQWPGNVRQLKRVVKRYSSGFDDLFAGESSHLLHAGKNGSPEKTNGVHVGGIGGKNGSFAGFSLTRL